MDREIEAKLQEWKDSPDRKPLVIRGARQVGKTYTVEKFGRESFESFIRIDFEKEIGLKAVFEGDFLPRRIFERILLAKDTQASPGTTLLFFDEIQVFPKALMSLRYFYEEFPELHVIAAGSLLEFSMGDRPFPVGRVEFLWMYPLNFDEFVSAVSNKALLEHIPDYKETEPVDGFVHAKLTEILRTYFIVGGMPEAVRKYRETESLIDVKKVHADLCSSYIDDFSKYDSKIDRYLLESIFTRIPLLVGKHLKYSHLADGKHEKIKKGFNILVKSLAVFNVKSSNGELPLNYSAKEHLFKTLFLDIGLMQHLCDISISKIMDTKSLTNTYNGALAEQFVGQQIVSGSTQYPKVYFWNRDKKGSQAELDYLISVEGELVPVEVKSGSAGKLKSLHLFLDKNPEVKWGYVFSDRNISQIQEQRIKFMPLYTRVFT